MSLVRRHSGAYRREGDTSLIEIRLRELRQLFVRGAISLLIGLAFLAVCLFVRELFRSSVAPLDAILSEGLLILGWVAMWKPVEIFLYDWWPELAQRRLFERVAHMAMETQGVGPARSLVVGA